MQKPSAEALEAFDRVFPGDPAAVLKKMFGMPAGFVNGNMFLGVFANGVVLRLPEDKRVALEAMEGVSHFEPMPGRPWKEYLHADATQWGHSEELAQWAQLAMDHTATMPPKKPKARKNKKG